VRTSDVYKTLYNISKHVYAMFIQSLYKPRLCRPTYSERSWLAGYGSDFRTVRSAGCFADDDATRQWMINATVKINSASDSDRTLCTSAVLISRT